jgi:hypothetical protein
MEESKRDAEGEVVTTPISRLWLAADGIGRVEYLPGAKVTVDALRAQFDGAFRLSGGKAVPALVDIREIAFADREATSFLAGAEVARVTKAAAALVDSPMSRYLGNFFIRFYRPPYPTRLFTSEEEALKWLKEFLD